MTESELVGATWVNPDTGKRHMHDGSSMAPLPTSENTIVVFTASGISGTATGDTQLILHGALADGTILLPIAVVFQSTAYSSVLVGPTFSIGTNGPNYTNVMGATPLTSFATPTQTMTPALANPGRALAPSSSVFARCSVGATGVGAVVTLRATVVCVRIP